MCAGRGCGCGSGTSSPIRYSSEVVEQLKTKGQTKISAKSSAGSVQTSLLAIDSGLALEVLSTDENDKSSLLVFQKVGSFNALELKITKFDLKYPSLEVDIYFKLDPFDGGIFKIEGTISIKCQDIANPSGCTISVDTSPTAQNVSVLVNWDCLKNCAPQCLYCGGNWQCWLGCAGGCIIRCL